jgi:hypothetical protein
MKTRTSVLLARSQRLAEAAVQARTALTLADSDEERRRAQELLDRIAKSEGRSTR